MQQIIVAGPKDVMNWYSAQAECNKYGMSMLRISASKKVRIHIEIMIRISVDQKFSNIEISIITMTTTG